MPKELISIGYSIPGHGDSCVGFQAANSSLMDADVLLICPDSIEPDGEWVSFTSGGGGCYDVETSNRHRQKVAHLKKEIQDHLKVGKTVFIFMTQEKHETLGTGITSPRKNENRYTTVTASNYDFLPTGIGRLTSASGKYIQFSGSAIFGDFYKKFKDNFEYELYVEGVGAAQVVFTGKDKSKVLGAIYKVGPGHLVTLPHVTFNEEEFTEVKEGEDGKEQKFWNKKGMVFGNSFVDCLLTIDERLTSDSTKTPPPDWISREDFLGNKEKSLRDAIGANDAEIQKIQRTNERLGSELGEETALKDLLFEQGKPLEVAVIKALKILGYKAENYNDGELEMDQVILSPENIRYIGETEGKDNKDVNVTKFRQLVDALNADFAREEVKEKAFGILFGNAERLRDPEKRKLDFTDKCKSGAEREKIALVRTIDLFEVTKYLNEHEDDGFKRECREAIHKGLGKVVVFPKIPKT